MNIVMYYDSNNLGGVQVLFSTIVNQQNLLLEDHKDVRFYIYCDSENSIYKTLTSKENIVDNLDFLDQKDTVITPLSNIYNLYRKFPLLKSKLLLWSLHPLNSVALTPGLIRINKAGLRFIKNINYIAYINFLINKSILKKLANFKSIYFMDNENLNALYYFYGIELDESFLIPLFPPNKVSQNYYDYYKKSIGSKKALWIGRDDIFKSTPLIDFLSKGFLSDWELTLIGFENSKVNKEKLEGKVKKLNLLGKMEEKKIKDLILNDYFELGLGMGLSSLTIASYGIPTILINPSYSSKNTAEPIKLYKSLGYSLGSFKEISGCKGEFNKEAIKFSYTEMQLQKDYINSFSQDKTLSMLVEAAKKSQGTLGSISKRLKISFLQYLYKISKS